MLTSAVGDWLYNTTLLALVAERTGSAVWLGAATMARLLPEAGLAFAGGRIAQRWDRRKVMVVSDGLRAAIMLLLALVVAREMPTAAILGLVVLASAAGVAHYPAASATVPMLVDEDVLPTANAISESLQHVALAIGPAIAAVLLRLGDPSSAFALNAVTFLVAGALTWFFVVAHDERRADPRVTEPGTDEPRRLGPLVACLAVAGFVAGQGFVLVPLLADNGASRLDVGFIFAIVGGGGIVGAIPAGIFARSASLSSAIAIALAATGLVLGLVPAVAGYPVLVYSAFGLVGFGTVLFSVLTITLVQRLVEPGILARAFAAIDGTSVAAMIAGVLATTVAVENSGLSTGFVIAGALPVVVGIAVIGPLRRLDRSAAVSVSRLRPRVAVLERLSLFVHAPRSVLENVASNMAEESVPAGEVVVREGEPAAAFYVVVEGRLEVTSSASREPLNVLERGDFFGEIGLLRRSARTATVTCMTPSRLYRIDGDRFLDAFDATPAMHIPTTATVLSRLARSRDVARTDG